jgi:hypothetical protein
MSSPKHWNKRIGALALGLGLAISVVIGPCWWSIVRHHNPSCSAYKPDFISLYTGAKLLRTDPASLYDLEKQRLVQQPIDPSRGSWVLPFFYPPFFAVALLPLAWLPFSAAFVVMTAINLALLAAALRITIRKLQMNRQQTNWLMLATFCNYGVHYAFLEAQTSFIALFLLVLFVFTLQSSAQGRPWIWASLLFFKPQLVAAPFLILLGRRRWRELGLAFVVIALLCLLSVAAVGFEGMRAYIDISRRAAGGDDYLHIQPEGMHNLRALAYFFFSPPWRDAIWWAATIAVMALILVRSWAKDEAREISLADWITVLIGLILITPHLHSHDLALLIVPTAYVLKWAGDTVPPLLSLALVSIGILPLINTVAYSHLPPLLPIALLIVLGADLTRLAMHSMSSR